MKSIIKVYNAAAYVIGHCVLACAAIAVFFVGYIAVSDRIHRRRFRNDDDMYCDDDVSYVDRDVDIDVDIACDD